MKIETKFHGTITIVEEMIYEFPVGLPGFDNERSFTILPIEGNDTFQVLQSTQTPAVAFIVANPYTLVTAYDIQIDEPTTTALGIERVEDVFILVVVSVKEPFHHSTMNLQAPLVFNSKTKKGKQMIMNDATFGMRHPIQASVKEVK